MAPERALLAAARAQLHHLWASPGRRARKAARSLVQSLADGGRTGREASVLPGTRIRRPGPALLLSVECFALVAWTDSSELQGANSADRRGGRQSAPISALVLVAVSFAET